MMTLRKAGDRGHANHGWLDSYHTFSFADYYDPAHMGFRALRVINEDRIAAGTGFPTHPHRDMEIITYMLEGELAHRDSMGNGRTIRQGEVQGMSAGTGITHSEYNASKENAAHLLQIWIMPHTKNVTPSYAEYKPEAMKANDWTLIASERSGGIPIHQDASVFIAKADSGKALPLPVAKGRYGWLQVAKGEAEIAGQRLEQGDAAAFSGGDADSVTMRQNGELLLFDLA